MCLNRAYGKTPQMWIVARCHRRNGGQQSAPPDVGMTPAMRQHHGTQKRHPSASASVSRSKKLQFSNKLGIPNAFRDC